MPRETWESLFRSRGMKNPSRALRHPTASMKDGSSLRDKRWALEKGKVARNTVLRMLSERESGMKALSSAT